MQEKIEKNKIKLMTTLGNVIKKRRLALNKTIYLISAESAMSKSTWREAELGLCKDINLSTLWKISDGLEIPISTLLRDVEKTLNKDFNLSDG